MNLTTIDRDFPDCPVCGHYLDPFAEKMCEHQRAEAERNEARERDYWAEFETRQAAKAA